MILQLKIKLVWSNPSIWRRVLVDSETTFNEFHNIIQIIMDWQWAHLYNFTVGNIRIGGVQYGAEDMYDAGSTQLKELITKEKQKISYLYDFGDSWEHEILVEKILPKDTKITYPVCTGGKSNTPPEDCGGIYGFYDILEIIKDKNNEQREEMLDWLGEEYEANYFNLKEINHNLKGYQ